MAVTRDDIVKGLRWLGLGAGDKVMVHSSLRSFGEVEGGAETVLRGAEGSGELCGEYIRFRRGPRPPGAWR